MLVFTMYTRHCEALNVGVTEPEKSSPDQSHMQRLAPKQSPFNEMQDHKARTRSDGMQSCMGVLRIIDTTDDVQC